MLPDIIKKIEGAPPDIQATALAFIYITVAMYSKAPLAQRMDIVREALVFHNLAAGAALLEMTLEHTSDSRKRLLDRGHALAAKKIERLELMVEALNDTPDPTP